MMNGYGMGNGSGGWIVMIVVWVVLIGLIGFALVRLFGGDRSTSNAASAPTAREILDRRLATGEIDAKTHNALSEQLAHGTQR